MRFHTAKHTLNQKTVTICTLQAACGIRADICTLGASLISYWLPDRNGQFDNVVLSFADLSDYAQNPFYAGAVLAPNAGRIRNGILDIGNNRYPLTKNDGHHNLHGGDQSLSFHNWDILETDQAKDSVSLTLQAKLQDGRDGFPGNRTIRASYTLFANGTLSLLLEAATDKTTYLNLSNHSYFNLSGDFSQPALSQILTIPADSYIANNEQHLPESVLPVENTAFDFRNGCSLSEQLRRFPRDRQLNHAKGYNNGFILKENPSVSLYSKDSGRKITLHTDAPCLVVYSGGYLTEGPAILTRNQRPIPPSPSCAIALEAQDYPDAPGSGLFSCRYTKPGEIQKRTITWEVNEIAR